MSSTLSRTVRISWWRAPPAPGNPNCSASLTAGLALSFPPDRVNVLFFDFKGGSGLGPLTGLPHCVGMLTDLTRNELDRTWCHCGPKSGAGSNCFPQSSAPDLAAYRVAGPRAVRPSPSWSSSSTSSGCSSRTPPETLTELMRIAAIGRSLGIHLIMATQRPQGALTADIRANVTTSIALRVQSAHESADMIGTKCGIGNTPSTVPGAPTWPAAPRMRRSSSRRRWPAPATDPAACRVRVA